MTGVIDIGILKQPINARMPYISYDSIPIQLSVEP